MRRTRLALIAGVAGLLIPVAATTSASAVDQDLQVSTVAGPARTEVTVTSPSCPTGDLDSDTVGFLQARLISGTAPNEVLAGFANEFLGTTATIVVPDWIDPDQPAVIEAQCTLLTLVGDEVIDETFDYDPVAFDVEASAEPAVQQRTFSRTSLLAGQAFEVAGSGCFLDGADTAMVEVLAGSDLSARSLSDTITGGDSDVDGGEFAAPVAMVNSMIDITVDGDGNSPDDVQFTEVPTDIPAGDYTTLTYCSNDTGSLMFEPETITVTGTAPITDTDLTVPADSRTATYQGGSCTAGDVHVDLEAWDLADLADQGPDPLSARLAHVGSAPLTAAGYASALEAPTRTGPSPFGQQKGHGPRGLADDEYLETDVTPVDGNWTVSDSVAFDQGFVEGYAVCGDPLADGFIYDPQVAAVSVTEAPPTSTTTTTTTAPASKPATAVAGTPKYAG
jgi:hypothetical protein